MGVREEKRIIERKKMYKRHSQWVVASIAAVGLVAGAQLAAKPAAGVQAAATQTQTDSADSPSTPQQTRDTWTAKNDQYQAAKKDASTKIAAATKQASAQKQDNATSIAKQEAAQKAADDKQIAAEQAKEDQQTNNLKSQQDTAYAAAQKTANQQIDALNAQRTSTSSSSQDTKAGEGQTLEYAQTHNKWDNYVYGSQSDVGVWNGEEVVNPKDIKVLDDDAANIAANQTKTVVFADNGQIMKDGQIKTISPASWTLGDTIKNNTLTEAQNQEVNAYFMSLLNQYRKSLGLPEVHTTQKLYDENATHTESYSNTSNLSHNLQYIAQADVTESLATLGFDNAHDLFQTSNPDTMAELLRVVANSFNGLMNNDLSVGNGHREMLLGKNTDVDVKDANTNYAVHVVYDSAIDDYVLIVNGADDTRYDDGTNLLDTISDSGTTTTPVKDNNAEINQQVAKIKSDLAALKTKNDTAYTEAVNAAKKDVQTLTDTLRAQEAATHTADQAKIKQFDDQTDASLKGTIASLNAAVEKLNPGQEPAGATSSKPTNTTSTGTTTSAGSATQTSSKGASSVSNANKANTVPKSTSSKNNAVTDSGSTDAGNNMNAPKTGKLSSRTAAGTKDVTVTGQSPKQAAQFPVTPQLAKQTNSNATRSNTSLPQTAELESGILAIAGMSLLTLLGSVGLIHRGRHEA